MKRLGWTLIFALASVGAAFGQFLTTAVTAHVVDASGSVYVNCQWSVVFVGQNTTPGAGPYAPDALLQGQSGNCDSSGNLGPVNLADNVNTVTPTPSQWSFSICSATGYVPGNQFCKVNILITITGATQNIGSVLTPLLPLLPVSGGGGSGIPSPPFGSLQGNNGGTFGGIPNTSVNFGTGAITLFQPLTITPGGGASPFNLSTPTLVPNLNAALLNGFTFANPGPIGATPSTGNFTGLNTSTLGISGLFTPGGGVNIPTGTTVHIQSGASFVCDVGASCPGAGNPGSPIGAVQGNNGGFFAGIPTTSVNFATGTVTLNNSVLVSGKVNNTCVFDGVVNATFAAAVTCAGTNGTVEIPIFSTGFPTLTGNTVIASGVFLKFAGPSACINTQGFNLTINSFVTAPDTQIFCSNGAGAPVAAGTVTLPNMNQVPSSWFGSAADWNGSTGTDNLIPINACLASLTAGQCTLRGGAYKITAPISITKSSVSLIGVGQGVTNSAVFSTTPPSSQIITTSASADIIDVAGVNSSNTVGYNQIRNLRLSRSVLPTGTSRGLSVSFSYGAAVSNVLSEDSIQDFYFKGVGSAGVGYIENCQAAWGYNGLTETSGTLYGFFVDSAGAVSSPSIRFRNNNVANNLGHSGGLAWVTYGFVATGTLPADWHLIHPEVSNTDYGIYLNTTGTLFNNLDIQVVDPILQVYTSSIFVQGLTGPDSSFTVTGGLSGIPASGAAAPMIDVESSANVKIMNHTIVYGLTSTAGLLSHNSTNVQSIGNTFIYASGAGAPAVSYNGATSGQIEGSAFSNITATSVISLVNTQNVAVTSNSLQGTATNGILVDSASHGISGLDTNTFGNAGGTITHPISDSGGNLTQLNPLWYGADATGGSDSRAAINGALADCGGRTVAFTSGTYLAGAEIDASSPCSIFAIPNTVTIRKGYNVPGGFPGATGFFQVKASNVNVYGLNFDGQCNPSAGTCANFTGHCVGVTSNGATPISNVFFDTITVSNCDGDPVAFTSTASFTTNGPTTYGVRHSTLICAATATANGAVLIQGTVTNGFIEDNPLIDCSQTLNTGGAGTIQFESQGLTTKISGLKITGNHIIATGAGASNAGWALQGGNFNAYSLPGLIVQNNLIDVVNNASTGGGSFQGVINANISNNTWNFVNVPITSFTGTSGTLAFTTAIPNTLQNNWKMTLTGFSAPNAALNGQAVVITSSTPTGFSAAVTGSGYASGPGIIAASNNYTMLELIQDTGSVVSSNSFNTENPGSGNAINCNMCNDSVIIGNKIVGFGETGGGSNPSAGIALNSTHAQQAITSMAEVGNIVTVTSTGALSAFFQPGGSACISGATTAGYNICGLTLDTGYVRTSGTFQMYNPTGSLAACSGACTASAFIQAEESNLLIEGNNVKMPCSGIINGSARKGIQLRVTGTGEQAIGNKIQNNIIVGCGGGSTGDIGIHLTTSATSGVFSGTTIRGNTISNVPTGININGTTVAPLANAVSLNDFINVTTQYSIGSAPNPTFTETDFPVPFDHLVTCAAAILGKKAVVNNSAATPAFGSTYAAGAATVGLWCNASSNWTVISE